MGDGDAAATPRRRIQLLRVAGCPLADSVRATLRRCLPARGWAVEELVGDYPSPTLLVDGRDVVTGRPPAGHAACRLDLPTEEQIRAALRRIGGAGDDG